MPACLCGSGFPPEGQALEDFIDMLSLAGSGDTCHMGPKCLGKGDLDSHTSLPKSDGSCHSVWAKA